VRSAHPVVVNGASEVGNGAADFTRPAVPLGPPEVSFCAVLRALTCDWHFLLVFSFFSFGVVRFFSGSANQKKKNRGPYNTKKKHAESRG
jgi:hypothetical protein